MDNRNITTVSSPINSSLCEGEVVYSNDSPNYSAWHAFNNDKTLYPYAEILNSNNEYYLGYKTSCDSSLNGYFIEFIPDGKPDAFGIEISNDGVNYQEIYRKNSNIQNIESGSLNPYINYTHFRYKFYLSSSFNL